MRRASRKACATVATAWRRARIAPAHCRAALGLAVWRCRSLQLLQIMEDGDQFVRPKRHFWHEIARLDVLRIGDPGGEIAGVLGQGACGNRFSAGDMGQVGTELSAGKSAADG